MIQQDSVQRFQIIFLFQRRIFMLMFSANMEIHRLSHGHVRKFQVLILTAMLISAKTADGLNARVILIRTKSLTTFTSPAEKLLQTRAQHSMQYQFQYADCAVFFFQLITQPLQFHHLCTENMESKMSVSVR